MDDITREEWTLIRKALQCTRFTQMVAETFEGEEYRDTKIDELIKKIRALEGEG